MTDNSTNNDRRKFLLQSGGALGGLLASPSTGLMALLGGALAAGALSSETSSSECTDIDTNTSKSSGPKPLLRAQEPMNAQGAPFGYSVSGIATFPIPAAKAGQRLIIIIGHDKPRPDCEERFARRSVGVSSLEVVFDSDRKSWRHEIMSHHNRRWDLTSEIAVEGGYIHPDQPLFRFQSVEQGLRSVQCVVGTPWGTALCAERDGYLVEINPLSGFVVKRLSLGRIDARELVIIAKPGQPLCIYALGSRLFKFISHQRYEARLQQANSQLLVLGELLVADLKQSKWISVSKNVYNDDWVKRLQNIEDLPGLPEKFEDQRGLRRQGQSQNSFDTLILDVAGRQSLIIDQGDTIEIQDLGESVVSTTPNHSKTTLKNGQFLAEHDESGAARFLSLH